MAAVANRSLTSRHRRVRQAWSVASSSVLLLLAGAVQSQTLYKYLGADGHWVYSDRHPVGLSQIEWLNLEPESTEPGVWLHESTNANGEPILVAINGFASWVQLAYRIEASRNLHPGAPASGNSLIPPRDEVELLALAPIDSLSPVELSFSYQYIYGHPGHGHQPEAPYRLPYALTEAHRISQAYPDVVSHGSDANRHAIDFEMPIGTPVLAAREGIVIDAAGHFFASGLDLGQNGDRANFVRILHDDGTSALYGHLNWNSVRVEPGQRVSRGEHIADSGNTGFSTGPHLHFVVQRNRAGAIESVPVSFLGADGAITPQTGDRLVAH